MPAGLEVMGGEFSTFSIDEDNYHVEVTQASNADAKTSGRKQLAVEFTVRNDPNHQAKEGKKLTTMYQSYPQEGDDADKAKSMRGFWKRLIYDGLLQEEWPKTVKPFDPRKLIGKTAWVQIKNDKDGKPRVNAIAHDLAKLPTLKKADAAATGTGAGKKNGAAARR